MRSSKKESASASTATADAQSITLEPGECVVVSPESPRFKDSYTQVRPSTAEEVRETIGLSTESAKALLDQGACQPCAALSATVPADDLESKDDAVRARARDITHEAFNNYVYGLNPASLSQMKPTFERYLDINKIVLHIITLQDIEVGAGATLTISGNTHLVVANKIIIHGTGRIVCNGFTKFKVTSVEGRTIGVISGIGVSPVAVKGGI